MNLLSGMFHRYENAVYFFSSLRGDFVAHHGECRCTDTGPNEHYRRRQRHQRANTCRGIYTIESFAYGDHALRCIRTALGRLTRVSPRSGVGSKGTFFLRSASEARSLGHAPGTQLAGAGAICRAHRSVLRSASRIPESMEPNGAYLALSRRGNSKTTLSDPLAPAAA